MAANQATVGSCRIQGQEQGWAPGRRAVSARRSWRGLYVVSTCVTNARVDKSGTAEIVLLGRHLTMRCV